LLVQELKWALLLSDFSLVKNDGIMPKSPEFQILDFWNDASNVVLLGEEAQAQNEYRIAAIDMLETVVSAFIRVYHVLAEFGHAEASN
jgi:hypothetical protein